MRLGVAGALVDGEVLPGDVTVEDGLIAGVGHSPGRSGLAVPGLLDLQVNGFAGIDLLDSDPEGVLAVRDALLRHGVTAFQPTLISSSPETVERALHTISVAAEADAGGARIVGTHLEGPFLSPLRPGTHPQEHLRAPDVALMRRLLAAGSVTTMTLAPELPGAGELIDELHSRGVVVSFGHTDAGAALAAQAFDRGVRTVTHLFNAMRPFTPRDPGIAGVALAREDVTVQLIADGVHLAPETVMLIWRAAAGRAAIVSDSIAAAGLGDGSSRLGSVEVLVQDGVARREDGTIAGSVQPLIAGVRNLVEYGAPLPAAVDAAARVPWTILGRPELGRIAPGVPADVVVLDDELGIERVLLGGVERVAPGEARA